MDQSQTLGPILIILVLSVISEHLNGHTRAILLLRSFSIAEVIDFLQISVGCSFPSGITKCTSLLQLPHFPLVAQWFLWNHLFALLSALLFASTSHVELLIVILVKKLNPKFFIFGRVGSKTSLMPQKGEFVQNIDNVRESCGLHMIQTANEIHDKFAATLVFVETRMRAQDVAHALVELLNK
ncbi:uncharacterized protein LOC126783629 [Argentina anserina]|uniref:uncharacterized protein LOC126783629 n=1 Tax=Argentina anserina TaxID=57926 RepID=UPI0021765904|nr:uncharacterized protein LOC126783629 [Potentilla anserina]